MSYLIVRQSILGALHLVVSVLAIYHYVITNYMNTQSLTILTWSIPVRLHIIYLFEQRLMCIYYASLMFRWCSTYLWVHSLSKLWSYWIWHSLDYNNPSCTWFLHSKNLLRYAILHISPRCCSWHVPLMQLAIRICPSLLFWSEILSYNIILACDLLLRADCSCTSTSR